MENKTIYRFILLLILWAIAVMLMLLPAFMIYHGGDQKWGVFYLFTAAYTGVMFYLTNEWL